MGLFLGFSEAAPTVPQEHALSLSEHLPGALCEPGPGLGMGNTELNKT